MNNSNPLEEMPDLSRGRPHADDNLRWMELFHLAGVVMYESESVDFIIETAPPEPNPTLTIDEFMDRVEKDMRKHGIQITPWRLG